MAKSRLALLAFALAVPGGSWAQDPLAADEAIANQKREVREAAGTAPCPAEGGGEEIVVCGRRGPNPYRLPLPAAGPGDRVAGETPSAVGLTKEETCTNIGHTRGCPSFDILAIGLMVGKVVAEKVVNKALGDE